MHTLSPAQRAAARKSGRHVPVREKSEEEEKEKEEDRKGVLVPLKAPGAGRKSSIIKNPRLRHYADDYIGRMEGRGKFVNPIIFEDMEFDHEGMPILDEWSPLEYLEKAGALDATINVFGGRRQGKTTFTMWLMHLIGHHYPKGYAFSQSEPFNHTWGDWDEGYFPPNFVAHDVNEVLLQTIIKYQQSLLEDKEEVAEKDAKDEDWARCLLVFDDVIGDVNKVRFSNSLQQIWTQGRHMKLFNIFLTQHQTATTPTMRTNTDVAVLFYDPTENEQDAVRKSYKAWLDERFFNALWETYTTEHRALVVLLADKGERRMKHVFKWVKAEPDLPKIKIGGPAFWAEAERAQRNFNERSVGQSFSATQMASKGNVSLS